MNWSVVLTLLGVTVVGCYGDKSCRGVRCVAARCVDAVLGDDQCCDYCPNGECVHATYR